MEAAHITWRPLGRLLVEQGLLSDDELEQALAKQQETGERLGETIVKCGFVSGPQLAAAEAALAERERELAEQADSHRRDVDMLEELNERLREQVEALRREPEPEDPVAAAPTSHLVFVQLDERYELVLRDGPPPEPFTALFLPDVDEGSFVVAGSRRSPFPGDLRPCVVAERLLRTVRPS